MNTAEPKSFRGLIIGASIAVPALVALLFFIPSVENISPEWKSFFDNLAFVNACLNGTAFVVLIIALVAIKNKNIKLHKAMTTTALVLSTLFLLSYVTFHATHESTPSTAMGSVRPLYLVILLSHILLSIAIIPLVLVTFTRGLAARYDKHRKIARITMPIWLYITLTGVIVYIMISPYYQFNL